MSEYVTSKDLRNWNFFSYREESRTKEVRKKSAAPKKLKEKKMPVVEIEDNRVNNDTAKASAAKAAARYEEKKKCIPVVEKVFADMLESEKYFYTTNKTIVMRRVAWEHFIKACGKELKGVKVSTLRHAIRAVMDASEKGKYSLPDWKFFRAEMNEW